MMTIEQLDAVPIGGKVKSEAFTFTRWSNETWNFFDRDLEDVRHSDMRVWASKLSPLTEPQTWQDVARSQGWWVASTGFYAIRGTEHGEIVKIDALVGGGFLVRHAGSKFYGGSSFDDIESVLDYANAIAYDEGGWA